MRYPILIEPGAETTAFGVVVPDLPGCFSAGDTLDDALMAAKEAATTWIEAAHDRGVSVPPPSRLETLRQLRVSDGWIVGFVDMQDS